MLPVWKSSDFVTAHSGFSSTLVPLTLQSASRILAFGCYRIFRLSSAQRAILNSPTSDPGVLLCSYAYILY